jgi:hypothetical protein
MRKRIEEVFGWTKAAAGFRKTRHRGLARVGWMFTLTATAYNLVRLPKLVGPRGSHARNLPGPAKTSEIDAKTYLMNDLRQLKRESLFKTLHTASLTLNFSAPC